MRRKILLVVGLILLLQLVWVLGHVRSATGSGIWPRRGRRRCLAPGILG